jgi:hypothetical protein
MTETATESTKVRKTPEATLKASQAHQKANKALREKYPKEFAELLGKFRAELGIADNSARVAARQEKTALRRAARGLFNNGIDVNEWPENLKEFHAGLKEKADRKAAKANENGEATAETDSDSDEWEEEEDK